MEAKYDFLQVPQPKNTDRPSVLYPKLVSNGTVTFRELTERIAESSTFKEGTILGVQEELEKWILHYLAHGYRVELGAIGTATATLKTDRTVHKEEEIHAQSIRFDKVKIQVSKNFSRRCQGNLVRAPHAFKFKTSSSELNEEERFRLLQQYLKTHTFISRTTYSELTGLLKTKAWNDLNRWVKKGLLVTRGKAPDKVYLLATSATTHNTL